MRALVLIIAHTTDQAESVVALPSLGVQLETTRGLSLGLPFADPLHSPCIPISTSATFMPLEEISTIVVNEGLRLWRVEYYLAVVHRGGRISVAYDVSPSHSSPTLFADAGRRS